MKQKKTHKKPIQPMRRDFLGHVGEVFLAEVTGKKTTTASDFCLPARGLVGHWLHQCFFQTEISARIIRF